MHFVGKGRVDNTEMTKKFELHIPSNPEYLRVVRAAVTQISMLAGFSKLECSKIVLAVDEACSNVIRHAYKNKNGQPIVMTCNILPTKLEITILDYGEPADIKNIKSRPLDDIRPGGLGVYIIRSVMDEVEYNNLAKNVNILTMAKSLPLERKVESGN